MTNQKILWVDDNPTIIEATKSLFAQKGVKLESIDNFNDALNEIDKNKYSGYLLDLDLGSDDYTGLDLIPKIRAKDENCPIFIFSANLLNPIWENEYLKYEKYISGVIHKPLPMVYTQEFENIILSIESELLKSSINDLKYKYGDKFDVDKIISSNMEKLKTCFTIMPFGDPFDEIYSDQLKPIIEGNNYNCLRGDEIYQVNPIINDIITLIHKSDLILADVTSNNPNVYYELGIAHALKKQVIIITQSIKEIPFDIKHLRCIEYTYTPIGMREFAARIKKTIKSCNSRIKLGD